MLAATSTPEEAWGKARKSEVYGALLDTNYVTFKQDHLYNESVLIDQRFHGPGEIPIRMFIRKPSGLNANSSTANYHNSTANSNKCLQFILTQLASMRGRLRHLRPNIKVTRKVIYERTTFYSLQTTESGKDVIQF